MTIALRIDADGQAAFVELDGNNLLRDMYRQIGCRTVDVVELEPGLDMWLDEESLLKDDPALNQSATRMVLDFHGSLTQPYFGVALIMGSNRMGDSTDFPSRHRERILASCPNSGSPAV